MCKAILNQPGILLGEKALLESKSRAATVITNEKSKFLILKKEDFNAVKVDNYLKKLLKQDNFKEIESNKRILLNKHFPSIF